MNESNVQLEIQSVISFGADYQMPTVQSHILNWLVLESRVRVLELRGMW